MRRILLLVLMLSAASGAAAALELTTSLLTAKPGSWTRRFEPHSHTRTHYVEAVTDEAVVLRLLRHHRGQVVDNKRYTIPAEHIRQYGANPDSPEARADNVEHKGKAYAVKIVRARVEESDGDYYISKEVPGNGVIRLDILAGNSPTTLWTDAYGNEPDALILEAGPGEDTPYEIPPGDA